MELALTQTAYTISVIIPSTGYFYFTLLYSFSNAITSIVGALTLSGSTMAEYVVDLQPEVVYNSYSYWSGYLFLPVSNVELNITMTPTPLLGFRPVNQSQFQIFPMSQHTVPSVFPLALSLRKQQALNKQKFKRIMKDRVARKREKDSIETQFIMEL